MKNVKTDDTASSYKLGYFQGISDLLCAINKLQNNDFCLWTFSLADTDRHKLLGTIKSAISIQAGDLMSKNGKNDYFKYIKVADETKNKENKKEPKS